MPRTPRFSSNISVNQLISAGAFGDIEFGLDYAFRDDFFLTASNTPKAHQPQYELWSARASWIYQPWRASVTAYVTNAKDEEYFVQVIENDYGVNGNFGPRRLYGLKFKYQL